MLSGSMKLAKFKKERKNFCISEIYDKNHKWILWMK